MWIPQANVFIGLCDAAEGKLDRGLQHAFESFDAYVRTGTGLTLSQLVPSLAEFLLTAGHADEAVARLDSMISAVTRRQELAYGSELYRMRARAKLALDAGPEARVDAEIALKIAREQGASALVARALQTLETVGRAKANSA
jgi:hypothetical protein